MSEKVIRYSLSALLAFAIWTGCGSSSLPKGAFSMQGRTLEERQIQIRTFDSGDLEEILIASAQLLQDLGFTLEEAEEDLGLVTGGKQRDATHTGQQIGQFAAAVFLGVRTSTDADQVIRASIVVSPAGEDRCQVRATFQRVIWDDLGRVTKREWIKDPEIYQEFFSALSKSIFLEAHEI
jgi:hypothetical protein